MADSQNKTTLTFDANVQDAINGIETLRSKVEGFSKQSQQSQDFFKTQQKLANSGFNLSPQATEQNRQANAKLHGELNDDLKKQMGYHTKITEELVKQRKIYDDLHKNNKASNKEQIENLNKIKALEKSQRDSWEGLGKLVAQKEQNKPLFESQGLEGSLFNRLTKGMFSGDSGDPAYKLQSMLNKFAGTLAAINVGVSIGDNYYRGPRMLAKREAEAIEETTKPVEELFGGGKGTQALIERAVSKKELRKAATVVEKEEWWNRIKDFVGGGIASVPLIGNWVADKIGFENNKAVTVGGIGRSLSSGELPFAEARAIQAKRGYANLEEMRQDLMKKDPIKYFALHKLEREAQENLGMQRQLGMGDARFLGQGEFAGRGFLEQGQGLGFKREQMIDMANQILSAGGTALGASLETTTANILQRNFNMTNAGTIMGKLTGAGIQEGTGKEAALRLLSEGTRIGLDSSKYADIQNRYMQNVSEIIYRTGATDENAQAGIAHSWLSGLVDKTTRGVDTAQTAYEAYQQASSQSGTINDIVAQGLYHQSFPTVSPGFISTAVSPMRDEDTRRMSATMKVMMNKQNQTFDETGKAIRKDKLQAMFPYEEGELDQFQNMMKKYGNDIGVFNAAPNTEEDTNTMQNVIQHLRSSSSAYGNLNAMQMDSVLNMIANKNYDGAADILKGVQDQANKGAEAMKLGDQLNAANAKTEQIAQQIANTFMDEFNDALLGLLKRDTDKTAEAIDKLTQASKKGSEAMVETADALEVLTGSAQKLKAVTGNASQTQGKSNVPGNTPPVTTSKKPGMVPFDSGSKGSATGWF
jgi:hypothetical protein